MLIKNQADVGEGSRQPTDPHHTPISEQPSHQPKNTQKPRKPKRKNIEVPQPSGSTDNVVDEVVYKELDDRLVRAATTASSLEAEFENVSKTSNDLLLARGNTLQSGEDSMQLKELMEICTNLQQRVLDLENTKTAQAQEITRLKLRVKKLEKKGESRTYKLKILCKIGRSTRAKVTLVDETQGRYGDDIMFDTGVLDDEEVFA
ncbi:hypothetical protein Tco_0916684, partial [Tanacetum coccineum]